MKSGELSFAPRSHLCVPPSRRKYGVSSASRPAFYFLLLASRPHALALLTPALQPRSSWGCRKARVESRSARKSGSVRDEGAEVAQTSFFPCAGTLPQVVPRTSASAEPALHTYDLGVGVLRLPFEEEVCRSTDGAPLAPTLKLRKALSRGCHARKKPLTPRSSALHPVQSPSPRTTWSGRRRTTRTARACRRCWRLSSSACWP